MIHPEIVDEAVAQVLMVIGDLGIHIGEAAILPPEADQGPRLRLLGQMAEDIVTLVRGGEAILRNMAIAAP